MQPLLSTFLKIVISSSLAILAGFSFVWAGSVTPPADPASTGYTLDAIYQRLLTNATATEASHDLNPSSVPGSTFHTLSEIYNLIPTIDPDTVLEGTTYLGIDGTIQTRTLSAGSNTVLAGYYNATTLSSIDTDLTAANIASGTDLFGVTGTATIASGTATAGQVLSGATFSTGASSGLTGTMTNVGAQTITPTTSNTTITAGYHDGTGYCGGDADLVASKIKDGEDIFGVTGSYKPNLPTCSGLGYSCTGSSGDVCTCGNSGCVNVSTGSGITSYTDVCTAPALAGLKLQAKEDGSTRVSLSINLSCLLGACDTTCDSRVCYLP